MPTATSSKKDKVQQRERLILKTSRILFAREGFLGMKMGDLAKKAGLAVGTVYAHFECKEDLILALATESCKGRYQGFEFMLEREELKSSERLIAAVFTDFLFSVDHPELLGAEQLSSTPSFFHSASDRRIEELNRTHKVIMNLIGKTALRAIVLHEFEPWDDLQNQAEAIDKAIWTLMSGSSYIHQAEALLEPGISRRISIPNWMKINCQALFTGLGWVSSNPAAEVERLADFAMNHRRVTF